MTWDALVTRFRNDSDDESHPRWMRISSAQNCRRKTEGELCVGIECRLWLNGRRRLLLGLGHPSRAKPRLGQGDRLGLLLRLRNLLLGGRREVGQMGLSILSPTTTGDRSQSKHDHPQHGHDPLRSHLRSPLSSQSNPSAREVIEEETNLSNRRSLT
jgi:hypothetical protein